VVQGQAVQALVTVSPVNFYQGLVKLSCGNLPTNVSCTFSPATIAPDGSNNPITVALTVNTNSSSPVVGQVRPMGSGGVMSAGFLYLPAGLAGLLVAIRRKRIVKGGWAQQGLLLLLLLAASAGLMACGTSTATSNSPLASVGSSVITLTATDANGAASHTISIGLTVQ
jgi:hypothetical protein